MMGLLFFLNFLKYNLFWQHFMAHIYAAERRVKRGLRVLIALKICYSSVEIHDFKFVFFEHFKTLLTFKKPHNSNQHCKRLANVKKPLQHFTLYGVGWVAYDVITGRYRGVEKVPPVAM